MPKNKTKPAKERLLATASRLFYQEGLRATGIDRIIAEAGVAKMSFYRHFPTKNDLIVAFLEQRHSNWMAWFQAAVEKRLEAPGVGLEVIAQALEEWFSEPDYRGCAFINAMAEGGVSVDPAVREVSVRHKADLEDFVRRLAGRLDFADPEQVAKETMVIVEGMIVRYQMTVDPACIKAGAGLLFRLGSRHA